MISKLVWKHLFVVGSLVLFLALAVKPATAQHPNRPLGLDSNRQAQSAATGIDHVDLFSGNLAMTIPIGPFSLIYNSNVWRYQEEVDEDEVFLHARVDRQATAGIGWHLGWGEVYSPTNNYNLNQHGAWLYVDEFGAHHVFRDRNLHEGDGANDPDWLYSRDGSYLRLHRRCVGAPGCELYTVTIEYPDGTTRLFDSGTGGHDATYHLHKIWGPHASEADPDFVIEYDREDPDQYSKILDREWRTVTDRAGRVHRVTLGAGDGYPELDRVVTEVDLETFAGQRSIFTFEYENHSFSRSCKDDWDGSSFTLTIPVLTQVLGPDGGVYKMADADGIFYDQTSCFEPGAIPDQPGVLTRIQLPTGGGIQWTYQEYEFPPGPNACEPDDRSCVFHTSVGVLERQLLDSQGDPYGNPWHYRTSSVDLPDEHPEIHTEVSFPDGRCAKHYFDAVYYVFPNEWDGWERTLPFVYSADDGAGKYLSKEVYDAHDAAFRCSGSPIRSTYVHYQFDEPPGGNDLIRWTRLNQRMDQMRTVYHLDGDRYKETILEEFNGVGGYRRRVTRGSFLGLGGDEERESYVNADAARGEYAFPFDDFVPVPTTERWLFGLHDYAYQKELDANGGTVAQVDHQYDEDGFRRCSRKLTAGTASAQDGLVERSANDVVTVFERYLPDPGDPERVDPYGHIGEAKLYGGDNQPLPIDDGPDCGIDSTVLTPEYWKAYRYQNDSLQRSHYVDPADPTAPPTFYIYDADIDSSSGLVAALSAASGYQAVFDYDEAGRVTRTQPQDGVFTTYDYRAFGEDPESPRAKITTTQRNATGILSQEEVELDDYGRPTVERRLLSDGTFSERFSDWDPQNRLTTVSQWGDPTRFTEYRDYDPFGRARTIRPPDGASHDVTIDYVGDRLVTTTVMRGTSRSTDGDGNVTVSESAVDRTVEYDSHGRMRTVLEPSGPAGEEIATTYAYDVGNRLTEIVSGDDPATFPVELTQTRSFIYDQRGMLRSETHPEITGPVTYSGYDSWGFFSQRDYGQNSLRYTRDPMGRLRTVTDANHGNRLVTELAWNRDDDLQAGLDGRLLWIEQNNYIDDFPDWPEMTGANVQVRHLMYYDGVGNAESRRDTRIRVADGIDEVTFRQERTFTNLGQVDTLTYPHCIESIPSGCDSTDAGSPRTVTHEYTNGWLTSVIDAGADPAPQPWASISYHDSGIWESVAHRNGVVEHFTPDPSFGSRPQRIHTTGAVSNFDSGTMTYDGAENLKSMGEVTYTYDGVGRLASHAWQASSPDTYTYDKFGNVLWGVEGVLHPFPPEVDPATNRFVTNGNTAYDAAGNLLRTSSMGEWRYDALNQMTTQNWMRYAYDGFGERTVTLVAGSWIYQLRNPDGQVLSTANQVDGTFYRDDDFIYLGNRLIADVDYDWNFGTRHYHLDHLGSTRLLTRSDGSTAAAIGYAPYGWGYGVSSTTDMLFTGHERNGSAGSDYMHARQYHSELGRFLSVDPLQGSPVQPQSLNRYAYVQGNPMNFVDPTGKMAEFFEVIDVSANPVFGDTITVYANKVRWVVCFFCGLERDRGGDGRRRRQRTRGQGNQSPQTPEVESEKPPEGRVATRDDLRNISLAVWSVELGLGSAITTYHSNWAARVAATAAAEDAAHWAAQSVKVGKWATRFTYAGAALATAALINMGIDAWEADMDGEIQSLIQGNARDNALAQDHRERSNAAANGWATGDDSQHPPWG